MLDDGQYKYFKFFSHLVFSFSLQCKKNKIAATAVADVFLLYDRGISILSKKN